MDQQQPELVFRDYPFCQKILQAFPSAKKDWDCHYLAFGVISRFQCAGTAALPTVLALSAFPLPKKV